MMKKVSVGLLTLMFALILQQTTTNASELIITASNDKISIYDEPNIDSRETGKLRKGESLIVTGEYDANWWQIQFGNAFGYIEKTAVHLSGNNKVPSKSQQPNSNLVVIINKNIDVYENSSGKLERFAILNEGNRYPVQSVYGNWWKINIGNRTGFIHQSATSMDRGIPILMYHHLLTAEEKADSPFAERNSTMIVSQFYEQMDYLKENGFTTIHTSHLENYLDGKINLPAKTVLLTLDDGNISSRIYAYPKLKELNYVADQFIITSRTPEKPNQFNHQRLHFLSEQEMIEMKDVFDYNGHSHALHTKTSADKGYLIAMSKEQVLADLLYNRELLNDTPYFAYPFGHYNDGAIENLKEAGFTMAFTTQIGRARLGMNKMLIPRMGIEPNLPIELFAERVNN